MNRMPIGWSESLSGLSEIVAGLRYEHGQRTAAGETILAFSAIIAKRLIRLACHRARKDVMRGKKHGPDRR
jgi:hypothetical protein